MNAYPIQQFIDSRCAELNISYKELIARTAFSNISVGLKRLQQLFAADFRAADGLIKKLPAALAVTPEVINQVISDTIEKLKLDADDSYRASFKPHFIIRTAKQCRPKQIFIASFLNAMKYVTADFPDDLNKDDYIVYAVNSFKTNSERIQDFFYEAEDIVINYSPDCALVVNLQGEHIEQLAQSVRSGSLSVQFR